MTAALRTDLDPVTFEIDSITHNAEPLARHGFPGYFATKLGQIISTKKGNCRVLKPFRTHNGYLAIELWSEDLRAGVKVRVHRLIAQAFFQPPDSDRHGTPRKQINHIDSDRTNNRVSNLEWSSAWEDFYHQKIIIEVRKERMAKGL